MQTRRVSNARFNANPPTCQSATHHPATPHHPHHPHTHLRPDICSISLGLFYNNQDEAAALLVYKINFIYFFLPFSRVFCVFFLFFNHWLGVLVFSLEPLLGCPVSTFKWLLLFFSAFILAVLFLLFLRYVRM